MAQFRCSYLALTALAALAISSLSQSSQAQAQSLRLVERRPDPHGAPRPFRDAQHVPLGTSIYLELEAGDKQQQLDPATLSASLLHRDGEAVDLLKPGKEIVKPARGWLLSRPKSGGLVGTDANQVLVYLEPGIRLKPETRYEVIVRSNADASGERQEAKPREVRWSFTTETGVGVQPVEMQLDLSQKPVSWQGRFFSGLCNVVFCTPDEQFGDTYALMDEARKEHPRAWSYQRDFWMTGFEYRKPGLLAQRLPNIVRERETRRIVSLEPQVRGTLLTVEDFFGHEQYGIESDRPLSGDYHSGDEVLIADGINDARAKVIEVDDTARTVLVEKVESPKGGWKLEYEGPLPTKEDPDAPGLFPPGGCYLRKFAPHGTPVYYWGRLDKEWDLLHKQHGRRLFVNFADAPGDLARDGRSWTTVKDYAQWHGVAKEMAGHVIDRYGAESLTFTWSIFNEPDLGPFFWRASWEELQEFYDYTTDAILCAFEERGYDSDTVFVGGLELGGIFGTNLRLSEFLAHCSPTAEAKGALSKNAAFADARLDGKRSRRLEELCKAHEGRGAPCDFVSIHAYNNSGQMAAKLRRAKEMALEMDPKFFAGLWVNSHEACPEWSLPPDEAAGDSYLGNGYFSTWCFDVVSRQLEQGAKDPRYARGETLITVWPPPANLTGINAVTRILQCDDDGDGKADRPVTVPYPTFHALNLLSDLGDDYWPIPRQKIGGHEVSGFASRDEAGTLRLALFAHHAEDTQSRSIAEFDVHLKLGGVPPPETKRVHLSEYRFDSEHNSYLAKVKEINGRASSEAESEEDVDEVLRHLSSDDSGQQLAAMRKVESLAPASQFKTLTLIAKLAENAADTEVRAAATQIIARLIFASTKSRPGLARADVEEIEQLSRLRTSRSEIVALEAEGPLTLRARIRGNGLSILVLKPVKDGP